MRAKLAGTSFGEAPPGRRIVIEEGMVGPELSVLAVAHGRNAVALAPAQDFKRAPTTATPRPQHRRHGRLLPVLCRRCPTTCSSEVIDRFVFSTSC